MIENYFLKFVVTKRKRKSLVFVEKNLHLWNVHLFYFDLPKMYTQV